VFSVSFDDDRNRLFNVYTVAQNDAPVLARNGLSVNPKYTFENCPKPDIFLVPGGQGTRTEVNNPVVIDWIRSHEPDAELVLSVCTGALLLAKAGLLDNLQATTYHTAFDTPTRPRPERTGSCGTRMQFAKHNPSDTGT
jgi:transcriptional regulator GlxA family with amidase domain